MIDRGEPALDAAGLAVPLAGRLVATGDRWEPYRLLDSRGVAVEAARAYFGHLQAAGRSDLPRAFRTADLWLIHATDCCSRYSSWTCCGVRY